MKTKTTPSMRRKPRRRRVLIVNGVTVWREAIRSRINRSPDLKVCGEAFGEKAGFAQVKRLHPGLVLTEILRPQDLGFIRELHRRHPRLPILTFSFRDEEAYAPLALDAGARLPHEGRGRRHTCEWHSPGFERASGPQPGDGEALTPLEFTRTPKLEWVAQPTRLCRPATGRTERAGRW